MQLVKSIRNYKGYVIKRLLVRISRADFTVYQIYTESGEWVTTRKLLKEAKSFVDNIA